MTKYTPRSVLYFGLPWAKSPKLRLEERDLGLAVEQLLERYRARYPSMTRNWDVRSLSEFPPHPSQYHQTSSARNTKMTMNSETETRAAATKLAKTLGAGWFPEVWCSEGHYWLYAAVLEGLFTIRVTEHTYAQSERTPSYTAWLHTGYESPGGVETRFVRSGSTAKEAVTLVAQATRVAVNHMTKTLNALESKGAS